jgi:hypothetical protein
VKATFIALIPAVSASGTAHDMLVEQLYDGRVQCTVMGADGKKRHASSIFPVGVDPHAVVSALRG